MRAIAALALIILTLSFHDYRTSGSPPDIDALTAFVIALSVLIAKPLHDFIEQKFRRNL